MIHRNRTLLGLLAALGLLVASCAGGGKPAAPAPSQPTPAQPAPAAPAPQQSSAVAPGSGSADTIKIGIVSFLSGPAAAPFGIPGRNAAELMADAINNGTVPTPYQQKGIAGKKIQLVFVDEAGSTDEQVSNLRRLALDEKVDLVIGYISSGNCLATAPVAEQLRLLTVFFDCGTNQLFEQRAYKYVFRTTSHQIIDSVGAARYVAELKPDLKTMAGLNQNYAWGQDSWKAFSESMKQLVPGIQTVTEQFPKLFGGDYSAEISAVLSKRPQVTHTSHWGGDLESLVIQGAPRGLFKQTLVVAVAGDPLLTRMKKDVPEGVVVGARGPYGMVAPDTELNRWFVKAYTDRYGVRPVYPSYHMANGFLGVKNAFEKAMAAAGNKFPTNDQVISAFENSEFDTPGGKVKMAIGKGHQAINGTAYGMTGKYNPDKGEVEIVNIKHYPAECVNPPDGVTSEEWIKSGFKGAKCS